MRKALINKFFILLFVGVVVTFGIWLSIEAAAGNSSGGKSQKYKKLKMISINDDPPLSPYSEGSAGTVTKPV